MHRLIVLTLIVLLTALLSCSTFFNQDRLSPTWQAHGLLEASIHSIGERGGKLYVGSDQGVYISKPSDYSSWRGPELDFEGVWYATLVLDKHQKIIAALRRRDYSEFGPEDTVLFKSHDDGKTWQAMDAQAKGWTENFYILDIVPQAEDLGQLIGYVGAIYRSKDGGKNWESVHSEGGFSFFITVSDDHPDHIWTGGRVMIFRPYLAVSRNGGTTWTNLIQNVSFNSDATARAAVVSPRDPDVVLTGFISFGPAIRKTMDGGQTWRTVMENYHVYTMKNSRRSSQRVFASGEHPSSRLSVTVSDDYGDSWTTYVYEDGPGQIWVFEMAVAEIDRQEVVFLGTNQGVYSFRLSK